MLKRNYYVMNKNAFYKELKREALEEKITKGSDRKTFPINRVEENIKYIELVCKLLNAHLKLNITIHPAGIWLLDNYYLIEKSYQIIKRELKINSYIKLPGVIKNDLRYPRISVLSCEIITKTDIKIDNLEEILLKYQEINTLTMDEICWIKTFLQIELIEKIRYLSEKIVKNQIEKYRANNLVERIIENKKVKKININIQSNKYEYLEYLTYKLKKHGKASGEYYKQIEDVLKKESIDLNKIIELSHNKIAEETISMQNCISNLKNMNNLNIQKLFENTSKVEKILKEDPIKVYEKMDSNSKNYYKNEIKNISKKYKISEVNIANKALEISKNNYSIYEKTTIKEYIEDRFGKIQNKKEIDKKMHIGYYLIGDGKKELLKELGINVKDKNIKNENTYKANLYINTIDFISIFLTIILSILLSKVMILLLIPIINMTTKIIQKILNKKIKVKVIPKINYENNIPKESTTMCIVPTILNNSTDVRETMLSLEEYYLANKSNNIFFTLLGDCTSSKYEEEIIDKEIINAGFKECIKLNKKYGNIFNFVYRKREWNNQEKCYMGWERKRGLINQFNEYLLKGNNTFKASTFVNIPKIKYIITLDQDTKLTINSAFKMIGAMDHILNKPEIDRVKNIVTKGHAIIQPRIGIDLESSLKNSFTKIFSYSDNYDIYTNAISDIYQDNFDEGIFTGKGIYDLEIFYKVLNKVIPENKLLSHDLLEGSYLRCGLASDILLIDNFPNNYLAYKTRKNRWIRGDFQTIPWLKSQLNRLSKYKIKDNIYRNLNELFTLITSIILTFLNYKLAWIPFFIYYIPYILDVFEKIIGENKITKLRKIIVSFMLFPDNSFLELVLLIKSLYRMKISHTKLLEWKTAKEADNTFNTIEDYIRNMKFQIIFSIITILVGLVINKIKLLEYGLIWLSAPVIMYLLEKNNNKENKEINKEEKEELVKIANKTWEFFKENTVNGLIIDNYQRDRLNIKAMITSPTNIGMQISAAISAYDLNLETLQNTNKYLKEIIDTVEKLDKWNGHLYNWYDISTLKTINPLIISSVDSGNFVTTLYVLNTFFKENNEKEYSKKVERIIKETNFSKLYNYEKQLFSIGYNVKDGKLIDNCYDLLASESRQTSIVAIANRQVSVKHWLSLGRELVKIDNKKGLISWGGTTFEYLMPNIFIPTYNNSLLENTEQLIVYANQKYLKKYNKPWGISESAYNVKDLYGNYQYKTFGIPDLGLKRDLNKELVISPYSTFLSLMINYDEAFENIKRLQEEGLEGRYGFFEAVDYTKEKKIIKTYMAHHQGMIISSINNVINSKILQKRFMKNPEIIGLKTLLQEKIVDNVIINKRKEKFIKNNEIIEIPERTTGVNVISTKELSTIYRQNGDRELKFNEELISKNKEIFIKNIDENKIYSFKKNNKLKLTPSNTNIKIEDGTIKASLDITLDPIKTIEIQKIKIKNKALVKLKLELYTCEDIIISKSEQEEIHPCFNKMFINYEKNAESITMYRRKRTENDKEIYYTSKFIGSLYEYEIDKENFLDRSNSEIPIAIKKSKELNNKIIDTVNPILAYKSYIEIDPNSEKTIYILSSISTNKEQSIKNVEVDESLIERSMEISKEQTLSEIQYLKLDNKKINIYFKMLNKLYSNNEDIILEKLRIRNYDLSNEKLWKYGISGDYSIIYLKINELNEKYLFNEIYNAYKFYKKLNVKTELVVCTGTLIKKQILEENEIEELNKKSGIFILENINKNDENIIRARSKIEIDGKKGNLEYQIIESRDNNKKENKNNNKNNNKKDNNNQNPINKDKTIYQKANELEEKFEEEYKKVEFKNDYYAFNQQGNEIYIKQNKEKRIPLAWSNILANDQFGSVITDSNGGFNYYKNSQTNKINPFENNSYTDKSSEFITIKAKEKEWSLDVKNKPDENDYYTKFGMGNISFYHENDILKCQQDVIIPINKNAKISILRIKNKLDEDVDISINYNIEFLMSNLEKNSYIYKKFNKELNMLTANNLINDKYFCYLTSNYKLNNNQVNIKLKSNQYIEVIFILGVEEDELKATETGVEVSLKYERYLKETKEYWKEKVSKIITNTGDKSFDYLQNGWLVYQTLVSRLMSKTGYYQSSGGYGFRDQIQDSIGMKWVDANILKNQIIENSKRQFIEGDVEHWWHSDTNLGIRSRYSDDILWFVYAVEEYINFTGDYSILDIKTPYLVGELLKDDEIDKVDYYNLSTKQGTILNHCIKAIEMAIKLGEHDLPLIKGGDWNDGMNKIGLKNNGESIWLGFFLYKVLLSFIEILKYKEEKSFISKEVGVTINENPTFIDENLGIREKIKEYESVIIKLRKALNETAWDGKWFIRAIKDNGDILGSNKNKECKIDSVAQSFSVISGAATNDKKYIAMNSLENYLIDDKNKLIKLLTPSLKEDYLGYITCYKNGMRENGGQYTHAAIWAIIAEIMLNRKDKAYEMYKYINPIEHTKTNEQIERYKVEPYVVEADIYSEGNLAGRGGWTWYTGSSAWMYELQIKYILGINIEKGIMSFTPCIQKEWNEFSVEFKWKDALYVINYKKTERLKINIDDKSQLIEENKIKLKESGIYNINVEY